MKENSIIDKILNEWAYRVPNGMPDPKNHYHLIHLKESLNELKIPRKVAIKVLEKVRKYVDNPMNQKLGRVGEPWGSEGKPSKDDKKGEDSEKEFEKGKVVGDPNEGDNQVKNDMLEYGYGGYEKATGSKPAPGGAGSAFNEIISGEGVHMLDENPDMSEEESAMNMYDMTKDTTLGKEQKKTAGIKAGEIPDVENKELYTKCLVSARSAKKKHERTQKRVSRLQEQGKMGEVDKTETYYGADKSLEAQVESINTANKVFMPDGTRVSKEDAIALQKQVGVEKILLILQHLLKIKMVIF